MSKKTTPSPHMSPSLSFETALTEIAQLVAQMEKGDLPLEESLAAYTKGTQLLQHCASLLKKVENDIHMLDGDLLKVLDADGTDCDDSR